MKTKSIKAFLESTITVSSAKYTGRDQYETMKDSVQSLIAMLESEISEGSAEDNPDYDLE